MDRLLYISNRMSIMSIFNIFVFGNPLILESDVLTHEFENQWAHSCSYEQECAPQKAQTRAHPLFPSFYVPGFPIIAFISILADFNVQ